MSPDNKSTSKGQAWFCTTGLPSDVVVQVDNMSFHLHKFPLISKSKKLHDLISEQEDNNGDGGGGTEMEMQNFHITLPEFPGGSETFEAAAKFCYGVKIDLSAANAVALRCAGEVLEMTEEHSEDNLISRADRFLSQSVFRSLKDSIAALKSCQNLLPMAENLGIVQRCIDTISTKAALVDPSLFGWPVNESAGKSKSSCGDPWIEGLSVLSYDLLCRLLEAMKASEVSSDVIENCLLHYAKRRFPGISRSSRKLASSSACASNASEADQRQLLESIVEKLPVESCSGSMRILFGLLRTANILSACERSKSALERKIGAQLEQVTLDDLLIPSYSYLSETLYDVDCVERILGYFLESFDGETLGQPLGVDCVRSPSIMLVGKLIDGYLSEIASDANLKPEKFCSLALSLPDQARLFNDGLYRAVDVYLKAHPRISDSDRERVCRVMDCQKLTLEACTHAAQNERLPLRAVVQVLFFEQLQLRHAIAGTLLAAEGAQLENVGRLSIHEDEHDEDGHPRGGAIPHLPAAAAAAQEGGSTWRATVRENQVLRLDMDSMKTRVYELERACSTMKKVIEKFDKDGGRPGGKQKSSLRRKLGCKFKSQVCDSQQPTVVEGRRGRNATATSRDQ